jgi:hypothetical protein
LTTSPAPPTNTPHAARSRSREAVFVSIHPPP